MSGQETSEALTCKEAGERLFRYPSIALALSLCLSSTGKCGKTLPKVPSAIYGNEIKLKPGLG